MATKQVLKTKPKPTPAKETKAKVEVKGHKAAEPPNGKTKTKTKSSPRPAADRDTPKLETKPTSSTRGKAAGVSVPKAKGTRRRSEPDSRTKTPRRQAATANHRQTRQPESNGDVATHGETADLSRPGAKMSSGATPTGGTEPKTARSAKAEAIFLNLFERLEAHAESQGLGHVAKDAQFDWGEEVNEELRPDLAFVSFDRWAAYRHVPKDLTWHIVPDLVVEIVRGSEQTELISAWLDHYFRAGVNRVWVICPDQLKVHDHDSLASSRVLGRDQSLDGGHILPGFQMPVAELIKERST